MKERRERKQNWSCGVKAAHKTLNLIIRVRFSAGPWFFYSEVIIQRIVFWAVNRPDPINQVVLAEVPWSVGSEQTVHVAFQVGLGFLRSIENTLSIFTLSVATISGIKMRFAWNIWALLELLCLVFAVFDTVKIVGALIVTVAKKTYLSRFRNDALKFNAELMSSAFAGSLLPVVDWVPVFFVVVLLLHFINI